MKERPLLMSGPLVLATLADRKTQTRRLPRPGGYGQPGDRLWVRETWACRYNYNNIAKRYEWTIFYDADRAQRSGLVAPLDWREPKVSADRPFSEVLVNLPSIHMPRWASRLTLEILEVRTEPLQAITDADVAAEGLSWSALPDEGVMDDVGNTYSSARAMFSDLWDKINGTRAPWTSNPEVTVITFRRVTS